MLEDFIQANSLKARILHKDILSHSKAQCALFLSSEKGFLPVLAVCLSSQRIDIKKLEEESSTPSLREADSKETERITGYSKEFLPPISVYGVKLLLSEKAATESVLFISVAEKRTLAVSPGEIISSNEDCMVAKITKGKN